MADRLQIAPRHRRILEALLREHLPGVEVWAYGSRVNGRGHSGSDLDLALRAPNRQKLPAGQLSDFEDAIRESSIPFLVEGHDWARLPERFHGEIERDYVVVSDNARPEPEGRGSGDGSSGQTVDRAPERWPERLFGDLTDNFDAVRVPVKRAERVDGPYPYYGASGVVDHVNDYLLDGEYLLVAEDGENLRTRSTPIAFLAAGRFWVNNHAHVVRGNQHADTRFLMYALSRLDISGYLTGSTMPKLTQDNMNRIHLRAPPLDDQRAITHILGTLDDKIELNRRMNATLESMARALFRSWFIDFDPVRAKMEGRDTGLPKEVADLFPDRLVESELGEIPDGWDVSQIGAEVDAVGGGTPSTKESAYWNGGRHCWATPKDLSKLSTPVLLGTDRKITDAGVRKISSGLLPRGTVLLSSRAPIGYLAITEVPTAVNQGFIAMICRKRLPALYVLSWCHENLEHIKDISGGSTFAEISKKTFRPLPVVVPSKWILGVYDGASHSLHDRVVSNTRESALLASLRDALLPRLVSGELRVNWPEPASGSVDSSALAETHGA